MASRKAIRRATTDPITDDPIYNVLCEAALRDFAGRSTIAAAANRSPEARPEACVAAQRLYFAHIPDRAACQDVCAWWREREARRVARSIGDFHRAFCLVSTRCGEKLRDLRRQRSFAALARPIAPAGRN